MDVLNKIIFAGGVIAAVTGIAAFVWKIFKWVNHQEEQDHTIKGIQEAMKEDKARHEREHQAIRDEQCLQMYGILACLKGLKEQGCDGPVTDAINKIEKHLNQQAHSGGIS